MNRVLRSPRSLGVVLLIILGVIRLPIEQRLTHEMREQKLLPSPPPLSLRESLGQMSFAATLGGLRSLVASITYLQAYVAFGNLEWAKVDSLMALTTRLQPQEAAYWDEAAWHMAYNAASNYLNNEQIRQALRQKLFKDHVQRGIDILNEGLQYIPNNPRLLTKLGDIYNSSAPSSRSPDPRKAAYYYLLAHQNGGQDFYERTAAYQLAKLDDPAAWRTSYDILKRYYDRGVFNPTMQTVMPELEEKLQIPLPLRVNKPKTPQKPLPVPSLNLDMKPKNT